MERRYRSPYRHWISGFAFEVVLFFVFLAVIALAASVILRLVG